MAIGLSTTIRNARLTAIVDAIDGGSGAGTLKIYSGVRPATGGALSGNTLLATLTFTDPCGSVSGGVLTFDTITADASADDDGTATWARLADSAGTFCLDLGCGESGSGKEIIFNSANFTSGGEVSISSMQITAGNA